MMLIIRFVLTVAILWSTACVADAATEDKIAVERLIKTLYSKPISEVEFPGGSSNMLKACEFLKSIAHESMLQPGKYGCDFKGLTFARYPGIDNIDLSEISDSKRLPGYKILEIAVVGTSASVKIKAPIIKKSGVLESRVVFFFKKFDKDWKITNVLGYLEWPLDLRGEWSDCRYQSTKYQFAIPPTSPAEFEDLPAPCRALELDDRRRNGWGNR